MHTVEPPYQITIVLNKHLQSWPFGPKNRHGEVAGDQDLGGPRSSAGHVGLLTFRSKAMLIYLRSEQC